MKETDENKIAAQILRRSVLEYRAKHNITQREFAKLAGLERSTVIKVENLHHVSNLSQIKCLQVIEYKLPNN